MPQPQVPPPARAVRRPAPRVRIGLIQGGCALAGLILAVLVSKINWEPVFPREVTIPVMLTVAFSIVGLVTILFSLMFTVVQWVYGTFSLRRRQLEDRPLPWWLFGLTIGIFVYSLAALLLTTREQEITWVVPGLTFLGTLVALILMRQLQISAFSSVQLGATLQSLTAEGLAVADAVYPLQFGEVPRPQVPVLGGDPAIVTWQLGPARVQQLDEAALVQVAVASGSFIRITSGVGELVTQGRPVAHVYGPVGPGLEKVFVTGADRTPLQDPLLPVRVLSDVALRALSPAVNDPATATSALDSLGPVLTRIAGRDLDTGLLMDPTGRVVAEIPVPTWEDFLAESIDDLVVCAAPMPSVSRRLDRMLEELADAAPAERKAPVEARRAALAALVAPAT
jgi:uncharacterized membrane protein